MGHPLRQPPGIHEDQAGSVLAHEVSHPVVDVAPNRIRGYRTQLVLGNLDGQIHLATMTDIHDARHPLHSRSNGSPARREARGADEEVGDRLDRSLRRRQADPNRSGAGLRFKPLQREREVRPALVRRHGVAFIHDHGPDILQDPATLLGGEQQIE